MLSRGVSRLARTARGLSVTPAVTVPSRNAHFDLSVGLNEDQRAFQEMALGFAAENLAPHAAKWDQEKFFPVDTIKTCAQLGFGGIYVKDDVGGSNLSRMDAAVIFEALATGCVSTSAYLTIHNMCAWMIDTQGTEAQRQQYLPGVTAMDLFCSYCLTEPSSGSDAGSLSTKAELKGDDYVLNGTKAFISGAGTSDLYLVMARTSDDGTNGVTCFIVPKDAPGLSFGKNEDKLGWNSQPTRMVMMDDCVIPKANVLGEVGAGFKIAMKGLDGGRINIGTTAVGGAVAALNAAIDYTADRKQFGKPIAVFQNTQFKLADMATDLTASRLMIHNAAHLLDAQDPAATMHCAMAKRFSTDHAFDVANQALQLHGGYGYLKDYPVERIVRDLRVHSILEGTNEIMRLIISRDLLKA